MKIIQKVIKNLSIFLVLVMAIMILQPETVFAKKEFSIFKELDNGYSVVIKKQ